MGGLATAASVVGGGLRAIGSIKRGRAEEKAAERDAIWMMRQAKARRAEANREAIYERRRAEFVQSRAQALAAASGAGASDMQVMDILADIEAEGEYRALSALAIGEDEAQGLEAGAQARIREGRAARTAGYLDAAATIFSTTAKVSDRFPRTKKPTGIYGPPQ